MTKPNAFTRKPGSTFAIKLQRDKASASRTKPSKGIHIHTDADTRRRQRIEKAAT